MTSTGVFIIFFLIKKNLWEKSSLWFKNHATYIYQLFLKSVQYISKSLSRSRRFPTPPNFYVTMKSAKADWSVFRDEQGEGRVVRSELFLPR